MNEVKPTYVTFEQAKWLKKNGFNVKSKYHYPNLSAKQEICLLTDWNSFTDMSGNSEYYTAPEQWQVVEWLRVNHNIWIEVKSPDTKDMGYYFSIHKPYSFGSYGANDKFYDTPQQAYSAAFDYIKENNLI
jgi:hypothetical protein